jgi:D-arabinose 1-dehydrogenase-like Zn-dependent alcohol dehydrogenase
VSAPHSLSPYFAFLKTAGSYCVVGVPPESFAVNPGELIFKRIKLGT